MKTDIQTTQIKFERKSKRDYLEYGASGKTFVAETDVRHIIQWESDGAFADIQVCGENSELISDAIRRFLLHKFPFRRTS